jgi:hypothetical protein
MDAAGTDRAAMSHLLGQRVATGMTGNAIHTDTHQGQWTR